MRRRMCGCCILKGCILKHTCQAGGGCGGQRRGRLRGPALQGQPRLARLAQLQGRLASSGSAFLLAKLVYLHVQLQDVAWQHSKITHVLLRHGHHRIQVFEPVLAKGLLVVFEAQLSQKVQHLLGQSTLVGGGLHGAAPRTLVRWAHCHAVGRAVAMAGNHTGARTDRQSWPAGGKRWHHIGHGPHVLSAVDLAVMNLAVVNLVLLLH
mmetsp:Transcript_38809/g.92768  ORF Transcript_38809/g.92768 Transcript_38809/m.92768 type:complete len:208 (-) Transcript_38809:309-932(-)